MTVRIERAELFLVPLELREPFHTSTGSTRTRRVMLVALHAGGRTGWGECVAGAVPGYSPETAAGAWTTLAERLLPAAVGADPNSDLASVSDQPMASAALELAAWDLRAKLDGVPLYQALGGSGRRVPAGVSIGFQDTSDELYRRVERSLEEGYRRIKVKIEPGRDIAPLRGIRDRFGDVPLSADANGSYALSHITLLREIDDLALMMIEQPLPAAAFDDSATLQSALRTPICLDESIGTRADAEHALDLGACREINVKPGRVGGLAEAKAVHDLCRERGIPVWCGGMLESGIGRAHNVALATLPGFTLPGDLAASDRYWTKDLVDPEWRLVDGCLEPSERPGIGVEPDTKRIEQLATRRITLP